MSAPLHDISEGVRFISSAPDRLSPQHDAEDSTLSCRSLTLADLPTLGGHLEALPPGTRSSLPHAHSRSDEFVYILRGRGSGWIDGELHPVKAGDSLAFRAGTGVGHALINDGGEGGDEELLYLVVGSRVEGDQVRYVTKEGEERRKARFEELGRWWEDAPLQTQGEHDGKPCR